MRTDEAEPGGQRSAQHEGSQHQRHHGRGLQGRGGRGGRLGAQGSAGDALGWPCGKYNTGTGPRPQVPPHPPSRDPAENCALTGGWPRHCDQDGLRQRVQVGTVGT